MGDLNFCMGTGNDREKGQNKMLNVLGLHNKDTRITPFQQRLFLALASFLLNLSKFRMCY